MKNEIVVQENRNTIEAAAEEQPYSKKEERDIANTLCNFAAIAERGHRDWRKKAKESYRFYIGNQWLNEDKEFLEDFGKPAYTYNEIAAIINVVSGIERQNRMDEKCYAKRNGIEGLAEIFTLLMKQASDDSSAPFEKSMAFFDGIISGKGWLSLDVNYENDPLNGDIEIKRESTFDIDEDPEADRYNLDESARFICKSYWWNLETIIAHYPKKEKMINNFGVPDVHKNAPLDVVADFNTTYRDDMENSVTTFYGDIAPKEYKYRVREFWWKKLDKRLILINVKTGEFKIVKKGKEKLAQDAFARLDIVDPNNWIVKERPMKVLNCTTMLGHTILEHIEDPFDGIMKFPYFRFAAYWVNGYIKGMVDDLKDPQRQANKGMSQIQQHLNLSANSGWIADDDAMEDFSILEDFGSTPGIVLKVRRGRRLERIEPARLSEGHVALSQISSSKMKMISGVNADLLGHAPERQESGRAMMARHQQGLTTSEIMFDNYRYTLKLLAEALLDIIRFTNVYSDNDIKHIVGEEKEKELDWTLFKSRKFGRYGIKISESPYSPTVKQANFRQLLEAAQAGVPIPPQLIIELSDFPEKHKLMEMLNQQETEQRKQEMLQQIIKNGGRMPTQQAVQ